METAASDASELQGQRGQTAVHKISMKSHKQKHPKDASSGHKTLSCFRCNGDHKANNCEHINAICRYCQIKGHIESACLKKRRDQRKNRGGFRRRTGTQKGRGVHRLHDRGSESDSDDGHILHINANNIRGKHSSPIMVEPIIAGKPFRMELDTGTALSVISEKDYMYKANFRNIALDPCRTKLHSYSGHLLKPNGKLTVPVSTNGHEANVDLYVVPHDGPPLFGRDWLSELTLDWVNIKALHFASRADTTADKPLNLEQLLDKHKSVFAEGVGKLRDLKAHLTLEDGAQPKFLKARNVPYSVRPKIEKELDRLQAEGVVEPIPHSEWATPIVPVVKKNGDIRICGDYRVTVNQVLKVDQYPMPKIDDIFANLSGGKKFTKIDLTQAYHQMELDDVSKPLLVINTHKGLYRYNRLVCGIASAPAIWQRAIEQVLQGIPFTQCVLDDIIITGTSDEDHLRNLGKVLSRLDDYGLRVNLQKCEFFKSRVSYCGHEIDADGLHKSPDKVTAVAEAPRPENVTQLRSFLGLVNYYHRFIPNYSTVVAPLNELLQDKVTWEWSDAHELAFQKVKDILASDQVLCHYDPALPLKLACDASPYSIGCVLSHSFPDGSERPIAYASRTLKKAERGYSQIDKEALSLHWGIQKFNTYLFGKHFTLVTDHKPLLSIFNPSKSLPAMTAARLQRYAVFLSGHSYDITYKNTTSHANADALSRLPLKLTDHEEADEVNVFYNSQFDALPVTCEQVRNATQRDLTLSQVLDFIMSGVFPSEADGTVKPFIRRKEELTVHQGCIMWGNRVVIPESLRARVMDEIHTGHLGIVRMKSHARSYVWWPNLDSDLEQICRACSGCLATQHQPTAAPVHPWDWPQTPW